MTKEISIALIKQDRELQRFLADMPDFDVGDPGDGAEWFTVSSPASTMSIATDGSGGVYLLCGPDKRVLYVTSDGQAGVVAADIAELITLMIERPYWHDLLKFSGGGRRDEMERAADRLEQDLLADEPDIVALRSKLRQRLELSGRRGEISALHRAVSELGRDILVSAEDGSSFDPLFNTFVVD